jgi:hypothetical protein
MLIFAKLARRAVRPPSRATLNAAARRMLTAGAQQSRKAGGWRYELTARPVPRPASQSIIRWHPWLPPDDSGATLAFAVALQGV